MRGGILLLVALLLASCGGEDRPPPETGRAAPAFRAAILGGGTAAVPGDYAGKVLALRFWADWCPYCRDEMKALQPVYRRQAGRGLEILAVNVAQDAETAGRFAASLGIAYPVLLDRDGAIAREYGVKVLPVTYLLDRRGVVRGKIVGEATAAVFEGRVSELLDER